LVDEENIKDQPNEAENGCMAQHALRNLLLWSTRLVYAGKEAIIAPETETWPT